MVALFLAQATNTPLDLSQLKNETGAKAGAPAAVIVVEEVGAKRR